MDALRPPWIIIDGLPKEEQDNGMILSQALVSLSAQYVSHIEYALSLKNFSDHNLALVRESTSKAHQIADLRAQQAALTKLLSDLRTFANWSSIALRDAAMTINHFVKAVETVKNNLRLCPTLDAVVDKQKLRIATKMMSTAFPQAEAIRNAVAHDAELANSPRSAKKNSHSGVYQKEGVTIGPNASEIRITGSIGGEGAVTYKGKIMTFALNEKTLNDIRDVAAAFYAAFQDAAEMTSKRALAWQQAAAAAHAKAQKPMSSQ